MLHGFYNTDVQIAMSSHEPVCANSEEYGQKYGKLVVWPVWHDSLRLKFGQLLITMGQKLTASSLKNMRLSKDLR